MENLEKNQIYCNAKMVERVSQKTNTVYQVCEIEFYCHCGVKLLVEDFSAKIPMEIMGLPVTFKKDENFNRYSVVELDYSLPYQYNMGITLLINHQCQ